MLWVTVCERKSLTTCNSKCKGHPRKGHECPEVEQSYSSTLSLTSALDVGGCSTVCFDRFSPRKQEARWAPGPVWTGAKISLPTGIRFSDRSVRSESLFWPAAYYLFLTSAGAEFIKGTKTSSAFLTSRFTSIKFWVWVQEIVFFVNFDSYWFVYPTISN